MITMTHNDFFLDEDYYGATRGGAYSPQAVICIDAKGKETVYASIRKAAKSTGARRDSIAAACVGRFKFAGGYQWRFAVTDDMSDINDMIDDVDYDKNTL